MEYEEFLRAIAPELDLAWRKYRRRAARRAVVARIRELGLEGFGEYLRRVRTDPDEARALPDRMRVTVTRFLRERARWDALFERVIPELLPGRTRFRVWSAGCGGGEEAYTFSLLWLERVAPHHPDTELSILATDIDRASLERAASARYDAGTLREVPEELRDRWFAREGGRWVVAAVVREPVRLREHNLMTDPPPEEVDLVLCRYLAFTYYQEERRAEAARRLHSALRPGGALMIGRKEGLGPGELAVFEPWPGAEGVFQKGASA